MSSSEYGRARTATPAITARTMNSRVAISSTWSARGISSSSGAPSNSSPDPVGSGVGALSVVDGAEPTSPAGVGDPGISRLG
ncbi:hypothetical protein ACFQER_09455 [Halomicroarcula sp. GCM10025894]